MKVVTKIRKQYFSNSMSSWLVYGILVAIVASAAYSAEADPDISSVDVKKVPDISASAAPPFAGKVVGGEATKPHSAPYVVSISVKGRGKDKQLCAGSLIDGEWIVTAAHCLKDPPYRLLITAGIHAINDTKSPVTQIRRCDFYRRHENYSSILGATGGVDIGVAHVSVPFEFTSYVQPIVFYEISHVEGVASIFGWGSTSNVNKRDFPHLLQQADLTLHDIKVCASAHNTTISAGTLCAGGAKDDKGACIGDSGGPLVQDGVLVGIVSWGPPTCHPSDGPSIFTNVGYYADWIRKQVDSDVDENNLLK